MLTNKIVYFNYLKTCVHIIEKYLQGLIFKWIHLKNVLKLFFLLVFVLDKKLKGIQLAYDSITERFFCTLGPWLNLFWAPVLSFIYTIYSSVLCKKYQSIFKLLPNWLFFKLKFYILINLISVVKIFFSV